MFGFTLETFPKFVQLSQVSFDRRLAITILKYHAIKLVLLDLFSYHLFAFNYFNICVHQFFFFFFFI